MDAHFPAPPLSADDLLVLLAVARSGRFTSAGQQLGLNHTTVARRIAGSSPRSARAHSPRPRAWSGRSVGSTIETAAASAA